MKKYFLSYDCANKSLGIIFFSFNFSYKDEIKTIIQSDISKIEKLVKIHQILKHTIDIFYLDVIDICPNMKITELDIIQRSNLFKIALNKINVVVKNVIDNEHVNHINVYIERQPVFNIKSMVISSQLIYEYANNDRFKIKLMYPMLKNQIYLHEDLKHSSFISNTNNGYKANKNHTKANFLHFIEKFKLKNKISHIKNKNLDDIADAFMQVLTDIRHLI